jgi:hypothetical protein
VLLANRHPLRAQLLVAFRWKKKKLGKIKLCPADRLTPQFRAPPPPFGEKKGGTPFEAIFFRNEVKEPDLKLEI